MTGSERRGSGGATARVVVAGLAGVALTVGLVAAATAESGGPHPSSSPRAGATSVMGRDGGPTTSVGHHQTRGLRTGTSAVASAGSTTSTVAPVDATVTSPSTSAAVPLPATAPAAVPAAPVSAPSGHAVAAAPSSARSSGVASALLVAIDKQLQRPKGIPPTSVNVALLDRWFAAEGGLWANNPLNTSLGSGAFPHEFTTDGQDTGIPVYPSLGTGITMTAMTLTGNPAYQPILRSLQTGHASCIAFANAVIRSPWASSHYHYDPVGFCTGAITPAVRGHSHHRHGRGRHARRS